MTQNNLNKQSFADILESGLGRTICGEFYFPYVQKIWGLAPEEISPTQAYRRVSANSMKKMIRKIFSTLPGFKQKKNKNIFFYPRKGFGQIASRLHEVSKEAGATYHLSACISSLHMKGEKIESISFKESNGHTIGSQPDFVWSTIPMPTLLRLLKPEASEHIMEASQRLEYRAMILVYIIIEQYQFSEYDAHYFPGLDIPITRISEPKNYSNTKKTQNLTVLCAELPCFTDSPEWSMTDLQLGEIVRDALERACIPLKVPIKDVTSRRISNAYPIYRKGYESDFQKIDNWLLKVNNLLSFGRQGLFSHDNIHHTLYMAYAAVNCLNNKGHFDRDKWVDYYRPVFRTFIVED